MVDFLLNQGLIFGPAGAMLAVVFLLDWRWKPLLVEKGLDLWLFAPFFAGGLVALVGLPGFPPRETIESLIYVAPGAWLFAVLSKPVWRYIALVLLTNLHGYFILQPLFADSPWSTLLQGLLLNGLTLGLAWSLTNHRGRWADGIRIGVGVALSAGIFATGSFVLGQIQFLACLPFVMLGVRRILSGQETKLDRFAYFGAVLPSVLLFEHLNYGF